MKRSALSSPVPPVSAALLYCSVISRSGLCRTRTAMSWPSRPAASSAMCQLLRATLCGLYCSLALLLLMVQGRHLSRAAVRVIQSDPIAGLRFLSSRHLPHKSVQSLLACNRCQALKCWQCSSPVKYCHPHQL